MKTRLPDYKSQISERQSFAMNSAISYISNADSGAGILLSYIICWLIIYFSATMVIGGWRSTWRAAWRDTFRATM